MLLPTKYVFSSTMKSVLETILVNYWFQSENRFSLNINKKKKSVNMKYVSGYELIYQILFQLCKKLRLCSRIIIFPFIGYFFIFSFNFTTHWTILNKYSKIVKFVGNMLCYDITLDFRLVCTFVNILVIFLPEIPMKPSQRP